MELNFRRNGVSSLKATGEVTCPATVSASIKSKMPSRRLHKLWYTAIRNCWIGIVLVDHVFSNNSTFY